MGPAGESLSVRLRGQDGSPLAIRQPLVVTPSWPGLPAPWPGASTPLLLSGLWPQEDTPLNIVPKCPPNAWNPGCHPRTHCPKRPPPLPTSSERGSAPASVSSRVKPDKALLPTAAVGPRSHVLTPHSPTSREALPPPQGPPVPLPRRAPHPEGASILPSRPLLSPAPALQLHQTHPTHCFPL